MFEIEKESSQEENWVLDPIMEIFWIVNFLCVSQKSLIQNFNLILK